MSYREIEIPIRFSSTSYTPPWSLCKLIAVQPARMSLTFISFCVLANRHDLACSSNSTSFSPAYMCAPIHRSTLLAVDSTCSPLVLSHFALCTKNSLTFNLKTHPPTPNPSVGFRRRPTVTKIYIQHTIECIQWQHTHFTRKEILYFSNRLSTET